MTASLLEMAKELVIAQIETHRMSTGQAVQLLRQTHTNLVALQRQKVTGALNQEVEGQWVNWRRSIRRHTVRCLECGAWFKQLSGKHLQGHGLDGRSYRTKYGIPRSQALAAQDTTAKRKRIAQDIRPWEKAPRYMKAQEAKTKVAAKRAVQQGGESVTTAQEGSTTPSAGM